MAIDDAVLTSVGRVRVRERISDRVFAELAEAIRDLRIPPGASLSETELAERLQVSRTPLREAIARLVETGLVTVVPQVGTRVEPIRLYDVEQAQFVRESLEMAAFAVACTMPGRDVSVLRDLLAEQRRACGDHDVDGFFVADEAFHQEIFDCSGYPGAWQMLQSMKMHLDRVRRLGLPDPETMRALVTEHTVIADALESGDAEGGQVLIRQHARRVLADAPALQARYPGYFAS